MTCLFDTLVLASGALGAGPIAVDAGDLGVLFAGARVAAAPVAILAPGLGLGGAGAGEQRSGNEDDNLGLHCRWCVGLKRLYAFVCVCVCVCLCVG